MMKPKVLATCLAFLAGTIRAAAQGSPLPVTQDTVALYQFDEGSGSTTADSSGHAGIGTLVGSCSWTFPSYALTGMDFAGSNAMVRTTPIAVGSAWTVQVWTLFPLDGEARHHTLVQYDSGHHHVLTQSDGRELGTYVDGFHGCGYDVMTTAPGWHLVTAVGSGGSTAFYVDANPVGSADAQETLPIQYVGNYRGGGQHWGTIDSLRILDSARTAAEIAHDVALPPPAPTVPGIYTNDGVFRLTGSSFHGSFRIMANVGSPGRRIQAELKPLGIPFDGTTDLREGPPCDDGTLASVEMTGFAAGPKRWRVRTVNDLGLASAWVSFFGLPEDPNRVDLQLINANPGVGTAVQSGTGLAHEPGETPVYFDADEIRIEAPVSDGDGDAVVLQIELRPAGTPFSGEPNLQSVPTAPGGTASCPIHVGPGTYGWRSRAVDAFGGSSPWTAHGNGATAGADFEVMWSGSLGSKPCAACSPGSATLVALLLLAALASRA